MIDALPLLTLWANAIGIFGGFLIGTMKLDILPSLYWKMTTIPLAFKDITSGLIKTVIFGVVISIVSCFEGFRTEGGAEGVWRSTTVAVVTSFLLIIAADNICTAIFYFVWR
jgi:phospholipid/cholesterol/gamma-HCH transport system permease protein